MSYEEALKKTSREERFMATVYAMNTLLIHKGIYAQHETSRYFLSSGSARKKTRSPC